MSFCIVVPTLNQGPFLSEALNCLSRQGDVLSQIIIYDAGSTDETPQIIQKYLASEPRAVAHTRADSGQSDALNKGFKQSTGSYLGYLNSDDILNNDALAKAFAIFSSHPSIDIVTGSRSFIGPAGRKILSLKPFPLAHLEKPWTTGFFQEATFWRRSAYERAGGFIDTELRFAMDVDLWVRMRQNGSRVYRDPTILGFFRLHGSSKSITKANTDARREIAQISNQNKFGFEDYTAISSANWRSIQSEIGFIRTLILRKKIGLVHKPSVFRRF